MAASHHFRTAFRGFHREDVVNYIQYLNNQHAAQIEQLRAQAQPEDSDLQEQLAAAQARIAELEAQLAQQEPANCTEEELEAYRRAERTERVARDRAQQIYTQAHAVLADVTLKAEAASEQFSAISQQIGEQMSAYQQSVETTRQTFQEAVATLYTIHSDEE